MVSWKKSFLHKHFQQSFHLWNTCNIVFPNHLPDMVFQSLVYGMEQTCRLKNTKCIKSTWLQKSQSIYNYPDNVSILKNIDIQNHIALAIKKQQNNNIDQVIFFMFTDGHIHF
jgi:hypothetical protein